MCVRFNGIVNVFDPCFKFMEAINIRMYYGGHFVSKRSITTYEKKPNVDPTKYGIALSVNVEEVCYFEFAYWIKSELGFAEVREIWYRKKGCTLHTGRARIEGDKDIAEFLEAPEKDGFYHLYVVHEDKVDDADRRLVYGPGVGFYTDSESTSGRCSDMASNRGESSVNGLDFYPNQINP